MCARTTTVAELESLTRVCPTAAVPDAIVSATAGFGSESTAVGYRVGCALGGVRKTPSQRRKFAEADRRETRRGAYETERTCAAADPWVGVGWHLASCGPRVAPFTASGP